MPTVTCHPLARDAKKVTGASERGSLRINRSWMMPREVTVCNDAGMAQRTQVVLTDDVDGSEATQTISFAFQGVSYEIDLNDDHASALEESFSDWISSARKVGPGRSGKTRRTVSAASSEGSAGGGKDPNEVRSWLRSNGHVVADRGRISATLLEEYDKAH